MIELFPGNYAWSQAALRAMFVGGSPGDVLRAVEELSVEDDADPERWYVIWREIADRLNERAETARRRGHLLTAASSWRRAAIYMQWSVAFLPVDDTRRSEGHRRSIELFTTYAIVSDPPIQRVEVPYEGTSFPAWLVRPEGEDAVPCAIYLPGWDSTKEQGSGLAAALAERGIATLLCDGPGIGEAVVFRGLPNRHDYEVPGRAAFEALLDEPRVDPARIAVVGTSLGSYRAARFAAFEPRLGFVVHSADYVGPGTERVGERFAMTAEPAVLRAIGQGNGPKKRFFAFGYCGWAPDQLESELKRNDWVTVPADDSLVFGENLDEVWKRAFERRGFDL